MKHRMLGATAAIALALSVAGSVSATPPGLEPNTADEQAARSANCIAAASAQWRHNGQHVTLGQGGDPSGHDSAFSRGEEIKFYQEACNNANEK